MTAIIAIGTSAGGQRALEELLSALKADLPAVLLVISHVSP
jgi:chemotaxis response regulator CheB